MNPHRNFLEAAIAVGLETGIVTPAQIMERVDAELLANHLPTESIAALLMTGMSADAMNPKLIVDTLGPSVLCEYMPVHLLWACVADAANRSLADKSAPEPGAAKSTATTKSEPDDAALSKANTAVAKTAATSAAAALAGATSKSALRRPNASRRPERLTNSTPAPAPTPRPTARAPGAEFDVDTAVGGWPDPDKTREARALGPSPLDDWNEETVTGAEAASPRKR